MSLPEEFSKRVEEAVKRPKNIGELENADAVGTVGSADCGDMLRMWVKFKEIDGRRVIDKATFQTFGCETAIAVASVATELISGKTVEEALTMSGEDLSAPLGPLPPLKIHCAQLVEGALRSALAPDTQPENRKEIAPTLLQQFQSTTKEPQKIILSGSAKTSAEVEAVRESSEKQSGHPFSK
jgi:nitrogen fixation protein NifU and related proteins